MAQRQPVWALPPGHCGRPRQKLPLGPSCGSRFSLVTVLWGDSIPRLQPCSCYLCLSTDPRPLPASGETQLGLVRCQVSNLTSGSRAVFRNRETLFWDNRDSLLRMVGCCSCAHLSQSLSEIQHSFRVLSTWVWSLPWLPQPLDLAGCLKWYGTQKGSSVLALWSRCREGCPHNHLPSDTN